MVRRDECGYQTSFALSDAAGEPRWMLTHGEIELAPALWKLLKYDETWRVYATTRPSPGPSSMDALEHWIVATTNDRHARELADAVRAQPPRSLGSPARDADRPGAT